MLFSIRHIASLKAIYGYQLLINLLGRKEGEHNLSMAYKVHNTHFRCVLRSIKTVYRLCIHAHSHISISFNFPYLNRII